MLEANNLVLGNRLKGVSCALQPGKITAICGPNGAGKSTLLEAMAGLSEPDTGHVGLDGAKLSEMRPKDRAKRIGYLPQSPEVAWDVPVRTLVQLGRMPHGDQLAEPVDAALAALDLAPFADRRAQSLSGGETARVLLARVLAGEPGWVLADEPLAALDLGHQLDLLRHLRRAADAGAGIILVLHDLAHAMNHADRAIVLDQGKLIADAAPRSALDEATIRDVWGIAANWVGESGKRALVTA